MQLSSRIAVLFARESSGAHRGASLFAPASDRVQALARTWICIAGIVYVADLLQQTADRLTDGVRRPFGDDFVNYWSAAFLAWHQRASEIYDFSAFHAFQQSLVGPNLDMYHYSYPPILLVLTAPLPLMPYVPALAAWLVSSWYCFYRGLRLAMPGRNALLLSLATPALFLNAVGGQNGAWTAALLGGGLSLLDRRPVLAGIMFGALTYKPQIGILLPIALLAGRQWRAIAAASATAGVLVLLSFALSGPEIWSDYLRQLAMLRQAVLEHGAGVSHRMVSVFTFARSLGIEVTTAYFVQAVMAVLAAACVAVAWFRGAPAPLRNALLIVGTCLATPYLQDYDLVMSAFAVAWLTDRKVVQGKFQHPALMASCLFLLLPAVASLFARTTGLSIGPLLILPAFVVTTRMILAERSTKYAAAR